VQREAEPEWQPGSQTLDLISQSKMDKDKKQPVVSRTPIDTQAFPYVRIAKRTYAKTYD